jgi:lipopolysaccharide export system protein LptC
MDAAAAQDAAEDAASRPAGAGRTNRGSLDSLTFRQRTTGAEAAARAAFMRRARIALPLVAVALIAVFFLNTRKDGGNDAFLNDFAETQATAEGLKTGRPEFSGVDSSGNPYEITAASAVQRSDGRTIYEFESPRAVSISADGKAIVEARKGVFDAEAKRLDLGDGVVFQQTIGRDNYVLKTPAAIYTTEDQTVVSEAGVDGEASDGSTIKADRMQANNQDRRMVFEGNVSMRIYPRRPAGEAAPPEAEPQGDDE